MDGPETSETKVEDKGEPEEAAAEIEAGGRRKEIADDNKVLTEKLRPFLFCVDRHGKRQKQDASVFFIKKLTINIKKLLTKINLSAILYLTINVKYFMKQGDFAMNHNKMTRVATNFDILANIGGKIAAGAGIVCVAVALLAFVFGDKMFSAGAITLDLDFVKLHLKNDEFINVQFLKLYVVAATIGGSILCFLVSYICKLIRQILAPVMLGRPFEAGISQILKKVGLAVLAGGFLTEVVGVGARLLLTKAYTIGALFSNVAVKKVEFVYMMDFDFVLIACVIFFLSYIFTYGQALQQESDETL